MSILIDRFTFIVIKNLQTFTMQDSVLYKGGKLQSTRSLDVTRGDVNWTI